MGSSIGLSELALWMATFYFLVNGLAEGRSIKNEQDLQMKASRKSSNRAVIKTIKTANGDVYDCVDIYKQPAFNHPRLMNHTIQMKPSAYILNGFMENREIPSSYEVAEIGLKNGGCPPKTVPIRKTQMNNTLMMGSTPKFGRKVNNDEFPHHYAVMVPRAPGTYYGTQVLMNIWKPRVAMDAQFTLSQIWVRGGPEGETNQVESGWIVYPLANGDYESRLFVLWTADDYEHHCYNFDCEGYVQVSQSKAPGMPFNTISTYGGTQYVQYLAIIQDQLSKNWLLIWGRNNELIGYWPKELFNHLSVKADEIHWGGETYGPRPVPEMGSAHFPEEGFGKACFMSKVLIVDENLALREIDPSETLSYNDVPNCYRAVVSRSPNDGTNVYFGGAGNLCPM